MAQTLSEIKALLAAQGLRPKHRLGQNFLHDDRYMRRVVEAAGIQPGDVVLEVGAGTGALSERLLEAGAILVAVEIDRDLAAILRRRLEPFGARATLVIGDVLSGKHTISPSVLGVLRRIAGREGEASGEGETPAEPIGTSAHPDRAPRLFKLVANLPYNVASPLLVNLACDHPSMLSAVVMVQREVADRLAAEPGGKDYGSLGVLVQAMCRVETLAIVPPGCFWPAPQIESAIVRLKRREQPLTDDPQRLAGLLHRLFSKRRKQLGGILGRGTAWPAGIDPSARPETLSIEQLVTLLHVVD
jgi:16S rRNA (adenine1518-N6/adenine1519-N6)-dimethyltransferase